ncbi:YxlC family protein [Rossellomorea aquimaris]|uniref:YxlC family protein n=1 Tax=Rossellomorea aquimaris TaxID=189382 RepID=UPI0007D07E56|nr:YxlC family protein [Rossellomorea aquimaris]
MNKKRQQTGDQDLDLKQLFESGFKMINQEIEENTPSDQWFEHFVVEQQERVKVKLRKELIAFLAVACFTLLIFAVTLFQLPSLFLLLQIGVFIGASIFSSFTYIKQVKKL